MNHDLGLIDSPVIPGPTRQFSIEQSGPSAIKKETRQIAVTSCSSHFLALGD